LLNIKWAEGQEHVRLPSSIEDPRATTLLEKTDVKTPISLLGDLIDLRMIEFEHSSLSLIDRQRETVENFEKMKPRLIQSIRQNQNDPLMAHILQKAGMRIDGVVNEVSNILLDSLNVRELNLGNMKVVDQLPFHARSVYQNAERKDTLLSDFTWMKARAAQTNQTHESSLTDLDRQAQQRLLTLHMDPAPKVQTLFMGRGSTITHFYEDMAPNEKDSLLFVGPDTGIWHGNYQLAQTSGLLEFEPKFAASNFNTNIEEALNVSQINARHFYKGLINSQYRSHLPFINATVKRIQRDRNQKIKADIAYSLNGEAFQKTVCADNLVVGSGLSGAKNVLYQRGQFYKEDFQHVVGDSAASLFRFLEKNGYFDPSGKSLFKDPVEHNVFDLLAGAYTKNQINKIVQTIKKINEGRAISPIIGKEDYEYLTQFNPKRGFTPIIDGNSFILSDAECANSGAGRSVLIWGGGGTAAAAVRRALFLKDIPEVKLTAQSYHDARVNEVIWVAQNGLNALRDGTLAVDAQSTLKQAGCLWNCCELTGIETSKNNRIRININRYHVVSDPEQHEDVVMRLIEGMRYPCVAESQMLEVDQLVYNLGQDNRNVEQLFEGINLNTESIFLARDKASGMPTHGELKGIPNIRFHGSVLTSSSFANTIMPEMDRLIESENVPPDVGPGSMPLSQSLIRSDHFSRSGRYYERINASMDFAQLIDRHLQHWGIQHEAKREKFIKAIVANRTETRGGITTQTLNNLISAYDLQGVLSVDSSCMLHPLKSAGNDITNTA
jgi:hypothetical protein